MVFFFNLVLININYYFNRELGQESVFTFSCVYDRYIQIKSQSPKLNIYYENKTPPLVDNL